MFFPITLFGVTSSILGSLAADSAKELTEDFMTKYRDKLNWGIVSKYQKMSISFIGNNIAKVSINKLKANPYIDKELLKSLNLQAMKKLMDV